MAWISFVISMIGMAACIMMSDGDLTEKGFLIIAYLFSVSSCLTLAKVIRDKHEADRFLNKIEQTKTEQYLSEHAPVLP